MEEPAGAEKDHRLSWGEQKRVKGDSQVWPEQLEVWSCHLCAGSSAGGGLGKIRNSGGMWCRRWMWGIELTVVHRGRRAQEGEWAGGQVFRQQCPGRGQGIQGLRPGL